MYLIHALNGLGSLPLGDSDFLLWMMIIVPENICVDMKILQIKILQEKSPLCPAGMLANSPALL